MIHNPAIKVVAGFLLCFPIGGLYSSVTGAPLMGCVCGAFFFITAAVGVLVSCDKKASGAVIVAILLKFILTIYQAKYKSLPMGGEDWFNYHRTAQVLVMYHHHNIFGYFSSGADLFSKLVALLYSLFGVHTMYINLFVLATSFTAAKYVWETSMLVTDGDSASSKTALTVFLFWPIDIIYSVTFLREMPIQMLCIASFYYFSRFLKRRRPGDLLYAVILISLGCMMHSGVIAFLLVYFMLALRKTSNTEMKILSMKNVMLLLVGVVVLRVSPLWDSVTAKFNVSSVEGLADRAEQFTAVTANTQYVSEAPGNLAGFILQMPFRAILFAVVPLPWMLRGADTVFAWVVDALPQLWLLYRLWKLNGMTKDTDKRIYYVACILGFIGTYLICGMGTTAYGNAIRHRAKIVPIVIVFVIALYSHLKKKTAVENG